MSEDKHAENVSGFKTLVEFVSTLDEQYKPPEEELKIDSLKALLTNSQKALDSANSKLSEYNIALKHQNNQLYDETKGLVKIAEDVSKYVKSVFGQDSRQFKHINELKFADPGKITSFRKILNSVIKTFRNHPEMSLLIIPFSGAALFIYKFQNQENFFSGDPQNWGQFADYFNWVTGVINTILLYSLTMFANKLQKTNSDRELAIQTHGLEKQLKFELYKDFLIKLEDYINKYITDNSSNDEKIKENATFHIRFIQTLAQSAKENFSGLIDNPDFFSLCDTLNQNAAKLVSTPQNKENYLNLTKTVTKIKSALFKQVKIDSK